MNRKCDIFFALKTRHGQERNFKSRMFESRHVRKCLYIRENGQHGNVSARIVLLYNLLPETLRNHPNAIGAPYDKTRHKKSQYVEGRMKHEMRGVYVRMYLYVKFCRPPEARKKPDESELKRVLFRHNSN